MAQIHVEISDYDKQIFSNMVGNKNMSATLRNYIKSYISTDDKIKQKTTLSRELQIIEKDKNKLDAKYNKIKSEIEAIEERQKMVELKRLEKIKKDRDKINRAVNKTMRNNMDEITKNL